MTLFVVLGLVAVVVGVLVAVALGLRSMRADGHDENDYWDSPGADSDIPDLDDRGEAGPVQRGRGQRRRAGAGAEHTSDHTAVLSSPSPSHGYGEDAVLGAAANAARAAGRPAHAASAARSAGTSSPGGRRRPQQKDDPRSETRRQSRPRSRRADADGWSETNWDRVSDEDYWAELSADKPLAAKTAQSAADLRSPEPDRPARRAKNADPDVPRPEPQTAPMAMPEYGAAHRAGANLDVSGINGGAQQTVAPLASSVAGTDAPATLPVRRSGNATDPGGFPSVGGIAGHVPADYADPNLAALAGLGGQVADGGVPLSAPAAGTTAPAPVDLAPAPVTGEWAAAGQSGWSYGGQNGSFTGSHAAPAPAYESQSYTGATPGYGFSAGQGYAAAGQQDAGAAAASAPGPTYGATPDQAAGRYNGYADVNSAYDNQHGAYENQYSQYAAGSYSSGSYGAVTGAYGTPEYGLPSYGASDGHYEPSYGPGAAQNGHNGSGGGSAMPSYAADSGSYAPSAPYGAPPSYDAPSSHRAPSSYGAGSPHGQESGGPAWGQAGPSTGRTADGDRTGNGWQQGGRHSQHGGGAAGTGSYASGYLSSSALSAHREPAEPERLIGPGSGNPYGSYVTGPASPQGDHAGGAGSYARPAQNNDSGYRDGPPYGGYDEYSGFGGGTGR